ncbi:Pantothenate kinase [Bertholletia excelsa]
MYACCWNSGAEVNENAVIKATGGGAYKFADLFKERLGVSIEKEDEMDCLVAGANFLLKAIRHEAFTHMEGHKEFVQIDQNDLFPYLLVNIGSGVSMIKVDGEGKFQRVSGTNVGGGTYWGLGKLLTKCRSFDELLELSQRGDNRTIDMLVGDIYGGMDYSKIGLSASTIASSFGKAISESKELEDYRPEDISLSLLRMISYNIGQIAYLNALQFGLKRIFFGGSL